MGTKTRLIKKYPNRRLYDTQTSAYITLGDVKALVIRSEDFTVVDAKTEEDLTRSVLLQIILEEESAGSPLFSAQMLAQMIRFYGNAMQGMMGAYLEQTMEAFQEIQGKMQDPAAALQGTAPVPSPELWTKFMSAQTPMIQSMMSSYIEQNKNMFVQMQEQMQQGTQSMMRNFPFPIEPPKSGK